MPIVPVFGGGGGSGPTPPSTPIWLEVPTQIERVVSNNSTLVYTIGLNTPVNGVAPFTYRVLGGNATQSNGALKVTGNQLELLSPNTSLSSTGSQPQGVPFRVLVWDSAGNFGVGALILTPETNATSYPIEILEEKVLDWDESTDGWVFAGPRNPPAGWSIGSAWASIGDGVTYPRPTTSAQVIGPIRANTPPGGFMVAQYYTDNSGLGVVGKTNYLVLRRKLDMSKLGWSWAPTLDFLDWNNLSSFSPTVPLGTSAALATVTESIPATGQSYALERTAYSAATGLTPTLEVATVSGGVAVLETQNTLASSRVVALVLRPALNSASQSFRMNAGSAALAVMARMRAKVTLTGASPAVDIKLGATLTGALPGIRIAGLTGVQFGTDPAVRISATRTGTLQVLGSFRRSVWGAGGEIGIDFLMSGGSAWICAYPWDPAWTDYPEWDDEALSLDVPNVIGPTLITTNSGTASSPNAPYVFGGPPAASPNGGPNMTNDMGVVASVSIAGAAGNGGRVEISNVQYYWKMLSLLGVVR